MMLYSILLADFSYRLLNFITKYIANFITNVL